MHFIIPLTRRHVMYLATFNVENMFELVPETINETSIEKTGRIIRDVNADVFCFVEVENRIALNHFNSSKGQWHDHVMLIGCNDDRGIDVGIMTRKSFDIESIASQVDDTVSRSLVLSAGVV
jgi:hypothetical protein